MTIAQTPAAGAPRHSVGQQLRAAREARGLDLAGIAQTTRVPLRHLVAIEADDHDSLPALPYTVGFVKTFANTVGLSSEEMAAQYRSETSKAAHTPQMIPANEPVDESRLPSRGLVLAALALVALIVAAAWAWGAGWFESAAPAPQVAEVVEPATQPVVQPATQPLAAAPVEAPVVPPVAVEAEAAPSDPAVPPADGAAAAPVSGGPIVITAAEEVWFKVYDRATRQSVRMGILQPGDSYTVPADRDDLLLWTGKAGALRLTVGGKPIPPLGGPQEMVKDVSLVPASLQARAG